MGDIVHGLRLQEASSDAPEIVADPGMLQLAMGSVSAGVLPHDLHLHFAIVERLARERQLLLPPIRHQEG